jgi:O-antigen/teichoic acid export membrane protein
MKFVVPPSGGFLKDRLKAALRASPDDRGVRRIRRAGLTGVATLLARGLTLSLGLVTLPLTSHYLGKERFGLWLTLGGFIAWFAVADLGLSNSLVNALSTAEGKDDDRGARQAVASAFWIVASIAVAAILLCLAVAPLIPWARIFKVESPQAIAEITPAVVVVLIFCALRLPASMAGSVYRAYQEGYVYQIWNGLGGLLAAIGLIVAIAARAGLPWLCAAFLGAMLMADLISAIHLFVRRREELSLWPRHFEWRRAKWLLRLGVQFWIAQMSAIVLLQTDLVIVSRLFGAGEVAGYGTTLRLFALIGIAQMAFISPLWAAYGEAAARGDTGWLSRTFRRSIRVSLSWSLAATALLFALTPLLFRWLVTPDVVSDPHLRLAVMITEVINSVTRCIAMLLNGLGAIRSQVIFGPVCGAANIALSLLLGRLIGAPGVAWATAICLSIFWVGVMGNDALRQLRTLRDEADLVIRKERWI